MVCGGGEREMECVGMWCWEASPVWMVADEALELSKRICLDEVICVGVVFVVVW